MELKNTTAMAKEARDVSLELLEAEETRMAEDSNVKEVNDIFNGNEKKPEFKDATLQDKYTFFPNSYPYARNEKTCLAIRVLGQFWGTNY